METWRDRLSRQAIDKLQAVIQRLYTNALASHIVDPTHLCDESGLAQSVSVCFQCGSSFDSRTGPAQVTSHQRTLE
jgi:hypothetical protein